MDALLLLYPKKRNNGDYNINKSNRIVIDKNIPKYISMSQLTDEVMSEAKSEIEDQLKSEGKPEQIWDKIVPGKMDRFISDNTTLDQEQCLLDQNFIKDESKSVADYISSYGDIAVSSFKRVSLG